MDEGMRIVIVTLLLLCVAVESIAQALLGKVVDASTQQPLQQAHIACPETGEGTVSDRNGNFKLLFKNRQNARTMVISFVGYQTLVRSVGQSKEPLFIELKPETTLLNEVVISAPNPLKLVQDALRKVEENHGGQRLLHGFYRMVTRNRDQYIQISEATYALNQYPAHYNQVKVIKAREAEDDKAFNGVGMGIGTPVGAVRNVDFTLKPEDSFLSPSNLKKHDFRYEGVTRRSGVDVHEISFDQKNLKDALYRGKLYLHTTSLAFVAVEYELSPVGISYLQFGNAAERAAMKLLNISIDVQAQRIVLTYRPFGNKWYLDHCTREEKVRVKSRRYQFDVPVHDRSEYLITGIDTSFRQPFADNELAKTGFIEAAADTATAFWQHDNIIPSDVDYDAIARQIEDRNGYTALKTALRDKLKTFPRDPGARVDSVLKYYYAQGMFNGTTLIKHRGQVILHKGYGFADRESQRPNDTTTVFRIGSIAKTFTSRLIWQLKQEGWLTYEDSVQRFVPWYPHHGITIHHLLTHSSGLPTYTNQAAYLDSIRHPFTVEELIRRFGCEKPVFAPGSDFSYSNTGYTLLALIAEQASGKTFPELFREKISAPIGLTHTSFAQQSHPALAKGYWNGVLEPAYAIGNTAGAGGISSTVSDLSKWDQAQTDPGLAELFTPRTWYHDWGAHYGYGWNIDKYQFRVSKKHTIQYHGGTDFGFKSMLARQPDKNNLVVLLNNTGDFPLFDITDLILSILN